MNASYLVAQNARWLRVHSNQVSQVNLLTVQLNNKEIIAQNEETAFKMNGNGFVEFYKLYPRKVGKQDAVRAWKSESKKDSFPGPAFLSQALNKHIAHNKR